ncbi:MAG: shikimate dehydrogenase family protein [Allosphingosinicella sp.]
MTPWAEVIGDPVAHSKSPLIHAHWLAQLGLEGDYRATRVPAEDLADFLRARQGEPGWRGCNVTIPHKEAILPLLARRSPQARAIGAVNCVVPGLHGLTGHNTDVFGVAAALDGTPLGGGRAVMIGAGGGARAALSYLVGRRVGTLTIVVRDPKRAEALAGAHAGTRVEIASMDDCGAAFEGAAAIVNASPLGMAGSPPMPPSLLDSVAAHAAGATLFDMVYTPLKTAFLEVGEAHGGRAVDGLTMLIGQARPAFRLLFGHEPPSGDAALRGILTT